MNRLVGNESKQTPVVLVSHEYPQLESPDDYYFPRQQWSENESDCSVYKAEEVMKASARAQSVRTTETLWLRST